MRVFSASFVGTLAVATMIAQPSSSADAPNVKERDLKLRRAEDTAVKSGRPPQSYAVVIGIGRYKNLAESEFLQFAESDAAEIYRTFISQEAAAFPSENVRRLIGPQATLANIRHELEEWLPSVAQPQDHVLVYFAGHGFVHQGRGYLAAYDVDKSRLAESGYPMTMLV